jgi:hypothetical protein
MVRDAGPPKPEIQATATKELVEYLQYRKRDQDDLDFVLQVLEVCKGGEPLLQVAFFACFNLCESHLTGDTHELKEDICHALLNIIKSKDFSSRIVCAAARTFVTLLRSACAGWREGVLQEAAGVASSCSEKPRRLLLELLETAHQQREQLSTISSSRSSSSRKRTRQSSPSPACSTRTDSSSYSNLPEQVVAAMNGEQYWVSVTGTENISQTCF